MLTTQISDLLKQEKSVVLVGPIDSGKSYWVEHELIQELEKNKKVEYFKEARDIKETEADIFIFDEVETLFDRKFLEDRHPEENPYYLPSYLEKVKSWHENYKKLDKPSLYIITRNSEEEIDYLVQNFTRTDWDGREISVFGFEKPNK
jgi:hypothetical protein